MPRQADVQVQVYDLGKAWDVVLDAAVRDGANQMNGLQFDVADRAPAMAAAQGKRRSPMRGPRQRFTHEPAGVTLGPIMIISESGSASGADADDGRDGL